jgi:hypothetical protein
MMNIIDGVVLEADVNIKWVSTMSGNVKGNPRMPERGMCRFIIPIQMLIVGGFCQDRRGKVCQKSNLFKYV